MEAETAEMEKSWAEEKSRDKAEISRLADKASEKTEFKARVRKNYNVVNREAVEAATRIRFSAKIQLANR